MTGETVRKFQLDYSAVEALVAVLRSYPVINKEPDGWLEDGPVDLPLSFLDKLLIEMKGQAWSDRAPQAIAHQYHCVFGDGAAELLQLHAASFLGRGYTIRALSFIMASLVVPDTLKTDF